MGWGLRAAVWGAGVAATRKEPTAAAVAVGGAAVLTTSAVAGDPALRTDAGKGISHGANLLVAAEGLTALRAALAQQYRGKWKQGARLVGAAEAGALAEVQREWVHEEEKENGLPYVAAHGALAQRRKGPQHCGQWRAGRKPLLHRL